jgi:hypothetical protein
MASIEVEDDKFEVLEARAEEKDFDSVGGYVDHLMDQIVEKIQREKREVDGYSDEEEKKVKQRLKDLGYMD